MNADMLPVADVDTETDEGESGFSSFMRIILAVAVCFAVVVILLAGGLLYYSLWQ